MLKKYFLAAALLAATFGQAWADGVPKAKKGTFALTNATIQTVTKGVVKGTLVIKDDKIVAIGPNVTIPEGAEVIDCTGKTIYPGMIDSGTRVGLAEIGSVPETNDYNELGDISPQMEALTAVNPNSVLIPVSRISGVTTVLTMPDGDLFPGSAALISLHGYSPEQMYAGFQGSVLKFPATGKRGFWDRRSEEDIKKDAEKAVKRLNEVWQGAQLYARIDSAHKANPSANAAPGYYPEMAALVPAATGKAPLLIEANTARDIEAAIKWIAEQKVKAILMGCAEGWRVADKIAKAGIPVLCGPVLSNPTRAYDRYDRPYANAGLMHKAGVKVAIRTTDSENVRNLPYHAGFAAAYGLGQEEALKAVTINAAEIFGVADRFGSLEVGKKASLFVATGDPFETKTQVTEVFIEGWKIPMESRQTRLYNEFLDRSPGVEK